MWDARFEAMRDRKLNELVIFSAMIRTDPANRGEYLSIIDHIGRDLDVIEALAEGRKVPESEPIASDLYRRRLSKYELLDEYCLDACRKGDLSKMNESSRIEAPEQKAGIDAPEPQARIDAPEEKSRIEAPDEVHRIKAPDKQPTIEAPDEPSKIGAPEEPSRIEAPEEKSRIEAPDEVHRIGAPDEQPTIEAPEEPSKIEAPEEQSRIEAPDEAKMIDAPEDDDDATFVMLIPIEDAVTLKKVRDMKDSKIDFFIDAEMSGRFKEEACEDVISFLKTDLSLIDKILSINIRSKRDIEEKISSIIELVEEADEPRYQKIYLNSLNQDEKSLEGSYNMALKRFEDTLKRHFSYLIEDKGSLFFE